jgi:hypothetical protein
MAPLRLFLCGDVMIGRGIDQVLPHPCDPALHEDYVKSALDYVELAEQLNGPIPRPVDLALSGTRRSRSGRAQGLTCASSIWKPASPAARTSPTRASITA